MTSQLTIPTPSTSLNLALAFMCRETAKCDMSDSQFADLVKAAIAIYVPKTNYHGTLNAEQVMSWFEDLSADEYNAMGGIEQTAADRSAPWA